MDKNHFPTRDAFQAAADNILSRTQHRLQIGIILGSGMNPLADSVSDADILPYETIPHFVSSTVAGHTGRLAIGRLEKCSVLVMQGRIHYYEGYSMQQVTFPIRVMHFLGIHTLIVTNAAGGLRPEFTPGDLMLLSDHINLIGMAGHNPLNGPNDSDLGPRFPDMSQAYDPALRSIARTVAEKERIPLYEGVYICLAGPSFETPADIRFLRIIGADAVGMSTVPEVTVARHMGMRVLGISGISNVLVSETGQHQETTHEEVLEAGQIIVPRLTALIRGVLRQLCI
ncbi:MAG: purine-nucleoside phosphorylase [Anaerolineae bacterium]|nr:purine-nucleoside phosphorylase [Anaerolineae bacterium]